MVKIPICYKNPKKPSIIDLIVTNRKNSFQNTIALEVGLSDFHMLVLTVLKARFQKAKPEIITYRDYRSFVRENFHMELNSRMKNVPNTCYIEFENAFLEILDQHAPCKRKYIRANEADFMNNS